MVLTIGVGVADSELAGRTSILVQNGPVQRTHQPIIKGFLATTKPRACAAGRCKLPSSAAFRHYGRGTPAYTEAHVAMLCPLICP